mgnify:CR=1 FL=1
MEPIIRAKNKKTGKTFEGTVSEARKFGFSDEFIAKKIKASQELDTLISDDPGAVKGTAEQEFKKSAAVRTIDELEKLYGRDGKGSIGLSGSAGRLEKGRAGIDAALRSVFDPGYQEDVNKYKGQVDITLGILTQAFGSGTPQEGEAARLIKSAPNETSTKGEADQWFKSVRNLLGTKQPEGKKEESEPQGQSQKLGDQLVKGGGDVLKFLFGGAKNTAQDINQSLIAPQRQQANEGLLQQA